MMEYRIELKDIEIGIPVVMFFTGKGKKVNYAIIDTGAEQTIFDEQFIRKNRKDIILVDTCEQLSIVGAVMEHQIASVVHATATVSFVHTSDDAGGTGIIKLPIDGIVMPLSHLSQYSMNGLKISAMLGTDVLDKLNSKIDFSSKTWSFNYDLPSKRQNHIAL